MTNSVLNSPSVVSTVTSVGRSLIPTTSTPQKDSAPASPDLFHHGPRDGGIVGDAAGLDEDRALADDAGLVLRQLPTVEPFGIEAVLDAASEEGAEPLELQIVCGHNELAALLERQAVMSADFARRLDARPAERRLQAAGGIIDAGMDDAAVVPGLVGSDFLLLLDDGDGQALIPPRQLQRGREADDASADDDHTHGDALPFRDQAVSKPRWRISSRCRSGCFLNAARPCTQKWLLRTMRSPTGSGSSNVAGDSSIDWDMSLR